MAGERTDAAGRRPGSYPYFANLTNDASRYIVDASRQIDYERTTTCTRMLKSGAAAMAAVTIITTINTVAAAGRTSWP
jgi:hypothetical protein